MVDDAGRRLHVLGELSRAAARLERARKDRDLAIVRAEALGVPLREIAKHAGLHAHSAVRKVLGRVDSPRPASDLSLVGNAQPPRAPAPPEPRDEPPSAPGVQLARALGLASDPEPDAGWEEVE